MNYPHSAYLHIPFCYRRCFYCDFTIIPLGERAGSEKGPGSSTIKSYLSFLSREIACSPKGPPLSTVYIGGGTPSLLSPRQIKDLLKNLYDHFTFQDGAEITLEIDPASFDHNDLEAYLEAGVNRVSLGAQSFNDNVLKQLGRKHTYKDLKDACSWIKDKFFKGDLISWNLDLIQNLPNQSLELWEQELSFALQSSAPHLSIYDLSIETGTVFDRRIRRGELSLPDANLASEISLLTSSILKSRGFSRYEISNYALPGHPSRHNRVYWSGSGWWGFGQGATSCPWGQRFARPRTFETYRNWVEDQELNGSEKSLEFENSKPIHLDDLLIVGLRRREGVDLYELGMKWGWNQNQCKVFFTQLKKRWKDSVQNGFLNQIDNRYFLSDPAGMEISNQILVEIILWWDSLPESAVHSPSL